MHLSRVLIYRNVLFRQVCFEIIYSFFWVFFNTHVFKMLFFNDKHFQWHAVWQMIRYIGRNNTSYRF